MESIDQPTNTLIRTNSHKKKKKYLYTTKEKQIFLYTHARILLQKCECMQGMNARESVCVYVKVKVFYKQVFNVRNVLQHSKLLWHSINVYVRLLY